MMFRSLSFIYFAVAILSITPPSYAQEAIVEIETDDTLPIAPMRYDDAVEPPKTSFSSKDGRDKWERYENGELDAKAYMQLQEEYNALVAGKPDVKRKIASQRVKMLDAEKKINSANLIKGKVRNDKRNNKRNVKKTNSKDARKIASEKSKSKKSSSKKPTPKKSLPKKKNK